MIGKRSRHTHKFYIKLNLLEDKSIKINKLSTIYNQLNIEESSSFDDFLIAYYDSITYKVPTHIEELNLNSLLVVVNLVLWKSGSKSNSFYSFKLFNSEALLKWFSPSKKYFVPFPYLKKKTELKKLRTITNFWDFSNKTFIFGATFVQSAFQDSEFGLSYNSNLNLVLFKSFPGQVYSYALRDKMLGRKINFRDRTLRKKIEIT